jgi:hypothetical protein
MSGPQIQDPAIHDPTTAQSPVGIPSAESYCVVRKDDLWFIKFKGDDYGPYNTEREAMLFAVDAAKNLGEQGQPTQVLIVDENGEAQPAWTFGQDPYPPRL